MKNFLLFTLLLSIMSCTEKQPEYQNLRQQIQTNEYFAFTKIKALDIVKTGFNAGDGYGVFLIDKEGIVQHQVVNNLPLGRNVDEALRVVEALQFTEEYGEVCPANWNKGDKAMKPDQAGLETFFSE